jgi:hypothetical protein
MSWNLTDEDECRLMEAVARATKPHYGRVKSSVIFEGKPMDIYPIGILPDTPEHMRDLCRVYEDIICRGAFAVDPDAITKANKEHRDA